MNRGAYLTYILLAGLILGTTPSAIGAFMTRNPRPPYTGPSHISVRTYDFSDQRVVRNDDSASVEHDTVTIGAFNDGHFERYILNDSSQHTVVTLYYDYQGRVFTYLKDQEHLTTPEQLRNPNYQIDDNDWIRLDSDNVESKRLSATYIRSVVENVTIRESINIWFSSYYGAVTVHISGVKLWRGFAPFATSDYWANLDPIVGRR